MYLYHQRKKKGSLNLILVKQYLLLNTFNVVLFFKMQDELFVKSKVVLMGMYTWNGINEIQTEVLFSHFQVVVGEMIALRH